MLAVVGGALMEMLAKILVKDCVLRGVFSSKEEESEQKWDFTLSIPQKCTSSTSEFQHQAVGVASPAITWGLAWALSPPGASTRFSS